MSFTLLLQEWTCERPKAISFTHYPAVKEVVLRLFCFISKYFEKMWEVNSFRTFEILPGISSDPYAADIIIDDSKAAFIILHTNAGLLKKKRCTSLYTTRTDL
jgi:hypothetical protein